MIGDGDGAELAGMPPGPGLSAALAGVDPRTVSDDDAVELLIARHRQLSHEQARLWAAIDEVLHRRRFTPPGAYTRSARLAIDGADEVRAALTWTRRAADAESVHAHTLVCQLPQVWRALDTGAIDRGKALMFARHLPDLPPEQITALCTALLPIAPRLTTGQLDERLRRMVLEIDPTSYRGRYRKALRDRKVVCYLDRDGAAAITATGLPADEAAAAMARVDQLARAARRAGHGTLDQIRTDTLLALLDGSVHGMTRDEIIHALIARYTGHGHLDSSTPDRALDGSELVPAPPAPAPAPAATTPPPSPPAPTPPGPHGAEQRVGIEIRVPLLTLLGLAERAGAEPGVFIWTSPLGRAYRVQPAPILPPPVEEVPREPEAWFDQSADDTDRRSWPNPAPNAPHP